MHLQKRHNLLMACITGQDVYEMCRIAHFTQAYADNCRKTVKNQILPYFGKTRLDRITSEDINNWLLGFKERKVINTDGKEEIRNYKNTYATTVFGTFWLMLNEAVNRGIIKTNPAAAVKKLKNGRKAIEIITPAEVRLLFPGQRETVWGDDRVSYLETSWAACTGIRASEILGLRGEYGVSAVFRAFRCCLMTLTCVVFDLTTLS
jgi:integrase